MANQWLRLWHEMPTDPKWRTIAKASKQRIGDVISVYVHLLVTASNANERGQTQSFNAEDVATALDLETPDVESILKAMQGRVMDGFRVRGWDKRQVAREDGGAERAKAWREQKRTQTNATKRKRTPDKDKNREDKEREESKAMLASPAGTLLLAEGVDPQVAVDWLRIRKTKNAPLTETAMAGVRREAGVAGLSVAAAVKVSAENGWQGFKASWLANIAAPLRPNGAAPSHEPTFTPEQLGL